MKKIIEDHLGWVVALFIGVACLWLMYSNDLKAGSNTLATITGGKVKTSHINQFKTALIQDFLPRNSDGVVTTEAGSLGNSTKDWLKAFIASGQWDVGDVKMHHTFNGTVGNCSQGWMLMDGDVINEANYNSEHSAGDWDKYIGSSPLDGVTMPDMNSIYPIGANTTTVVSSIGNSSHQINLQHTHSHANHSHTFNTNTVWYQGTEEIYPFINSETTSAVESKVHTDGTPGLMVGTGDCASPCGVSGTYYGALDGPAHANQRTNPTDTEPVTLGNSLSTTQNIQPESMAFQFCVRIID